MGGGIFSCFASNSVSPVASSLRSLSVDSRQASIVFRWSLDSKFVVSLRTPDSRLRLAISPASRSVTVTKGTGFRVSLLQATGGRLSALGLVYAAGLYFSGAGIFPAGRFFQLRLESDSGKRRPSDITCPLNAPPHEGARSMAKEEPFKTSSAGRAQTPCSLTAKVSARELAEDRGEGRALRDGETPVQNRRPGRLCDPAGAESSPSIRLLD